MWAGDVPQHHPGAGTQVRVSGSWRPGSDSRKLLQEPAHRWACPGPTRSPGRPNERRVALPESLWRGNWDVGGRGWLPSWCWSCPCSVSVFTRHHRNSLDPQAFQSGKRSHGGRCRLQREQEAAQGYLGCREAGAVGCWGVSSVRGVLEGLFISKAVTNSLSEPDCKAALAGSSRLLVTHLFITLRARCLGSTAAGSASGLASVSVNWRVYLPDCCRPKCSQLSSTWNILSSRDDVSVVSKTGSLSVGASLGPSSRALSGRACPGPVPTWTVPNEGAETAFVPEQSLRSSKTL